MPNFQGKFQYLDQSGASSQDGACRVQFDAETFTLTPESGPALVFDLGDLDTITAADYEARLALYTGRTIVLQQLGKAYATFVHDLTEAHRNRTVQCMLLEDMAEVARFNGNFDLAGDNSASGPAEIRLYKSNLAVLPVASQSFQWRLADIDEAKLDAYEVTLQAGGWLKFSHLAKRTEEFAAKINEARTALQTQTSQALHSLLPFLDPDQLQSCAALLREGRSAPLAKLAEIHQHIPAALAANAVDKALKPYYDQLITRAVAGMGYAGFKIIRPDQGQNTSAAGRDNDPDADSAAPETLYWFFFPIAAKPGSSSPANVVAWEASSREGRASYFFRLVAPAEAASLADPSRAPSIVDAAIRRLNRVLAMLNFRRRPIYLSDEELATDPHFHRYAIAARRMPEVREVRASFLGRALHASPEAWQQQIDSFLEKA